MNDDSIGRLMEAANCNRWNFAQSELWGECADLVDSGVASEVAVKTEGVVYSATREAAFNVVLAHQGDRIFSGFWCTT